MKIMVSACLLGENCKYDGGSNKNKKLLSLAAGNEIIPVCPEVMGGLPVPRVPCEIVGGTVVDRNGVSRDANFRAGALAALEIAKRERPDMIVLQSRSPSCGVKNVYDGTFSGKLRPGTGVFAKLLIENGFTVTDVSEL